MIRYDKSMFTFQRSCQTVIQGDGRFCIPPPTPAVSKGSCCPVSSLAFCVASALDFDSYNRCAVVSCCCFNFLIS